MGGRLVVLHTFHHIEIVWYCCHQGSPDLPSYHRCYTVCR